MKFCLECGTELKYIAKQDNIFLGLVLETNHYYACTNDIGNCGAFWRENHRIFRKAPVFLKMTRIPVELYPDFGKHFRSLANKE